jgi:drug/metabolite transporter (DMT)-like permease
LPFFWGAVAWHAAVKRPAPVARRDLLAILFLGFMGYYVASYLDFLSLRYISVGLERIILYLNPTIVLVLSAWLFGRRIGARQWQAVAVAYAGVTLVFQHDVRFDGDAAVLGGSLAFLGAVAYAIYLVCSGEIVHRVGPGLTAQSQVIGPVATVFLGWCFLGETVGALQLLGIAIVLASMAMLMTATSPLKS